MEKRNNFKTLFAWLAVLLVLFSLVLTGSGASLTAFAESTEYTSVLEDLTKDKNFTASDYPANGEDNSLQVIQIAESTEKELFVYVYQPSAFVRELTATHISIATDKDNLNPQMYTLTLLDRQGIFGKYLVNGLTVKDDDLRCYDIIEIFRKWDKDIDESATGGNTINEVSYEVAQLWSANTIESGEVLYHCEATEVITVTGKLCGFLRYGLLFEQTDAWFIAFTTDKPIEELLEADVYYVSKDFVGGHSDEYFDELYPNPGLGIYLLPPVYDTPKEYIKTVDFKDTGANVVEDTIAGSDGVNDKWENARHFFVQRKTHVFDRIQTVEEFKNGEKLTGGSKDELAGLSWVLRFVETPYYNSVGNIPIYRDIDMYGYHWEDIYIMGTEVSSVSIMRLKFRTAGKVYNLGVVDNMQTSSFKPFGGGYYGSEGGLPWWVYLIIAIVVLAIASPILAIVFPPVGALLKVVMKGILKGIGYLFKGLWWLICLPFRGVAALFKRGKGD